MHNEPELHVLAECIRQAGESYIDGKEEIEGWKLKYTELTRKMRKFNPKTKEYRGHHSSRQG